METAENEFKVLLSYSQYVNLVNLANSNSGKCKKQINFYFDSPMFDLYKSGSTLRIRETDSSYLCTLKVFIDHANGARNCTEYSEKITKDYFVQLLSGASSINQIFGNRNNCTLPQYVGFMITERTAFRYKDISFELDNNYYLNKIDYELECEFETTDNREYISRTLRDLGLSFTNNRSKYERYVDSLRLFHFG